MLSARTLVLGLLSGVSAETIFQDTPLTTDLWQLVSKNDASKTDEALEAFMYQNPDLANARSADKRGGLWWAWEYKNDFALAVFKAYGANPESTEEDDDGNTPKSMCAGEEGECEELLKGLDDIEKGVLERKKAKEEQEEKDLDEEEDDDLDDDDGGIRINKDASSGAKKKRDDGSLNVDVDDDEDEEL